MNALEVLIEQLDEDLAGVTAALQTGQVDTMNDFKFLRGQYWGLLVAKDKVQALLKQIEES